MAKYIGRILKDELIFSISLILALATSFFTGFDIANIDFKVIILLFNLMIVIQAFERYKLLDFISHRLLMRFKDKRSIGFVIIIITGVFASIITNDVALITLVPITILIGKKSGFQPQWIVILQTLAANIGSSLTPMGNPQNLFLYEYYKIPINIFFRTMSLYVFLGFIWLFILNLKNNREYLVFELSPILFNKKRIFYYLLLFIIIILSVFRFLDYRMVFILTLFLFIIFDKDLILKVDYYLLATFVCFFIFIGNISDLPYIKSFFTIFLANERLVLISSVLTSQIISNVPSAILLSSFTMNFKELLLGVNIGGMGTIIASLASVISYKIYIKEYGNSDYLIKFHIVNIVSLGLFIFIGLLII